VNAKNNLGRCGEQAAVEYLERAGLRTKVGVIARRLPSVATTSKNSSADLSSFGVAR
jgi:hypothetical protein